MKRVYIITLAVCLAILGAFGSVYRPWAETGRNETIKVGFLYENDETTAYTHNFARVQTALKSAYGDAVEIQTLSNVREKETREPLIRLVREGCAIIFVYSYTEQVAAVASEFPGTQFCQISRSDTEGVPYPANYHTFNAEAWQARYVSGIAAGMKLRQLIDEGTLSRDEALLGFVGSYPVPEVHSACAAFLLGARSVAPEAKLLLDYTHSWCSYRQEKAVAEALIEAGCVILSQHPPTLGPADACEAAAQQRRTVYHIGQDMSMLDIAPTAALTSVRVNWSGYVLGAVDAVKHRRLIESAVSGHIHGSDVSGGFAEGWLELMDLSHQNAAPGTLEALEKAVAALKKGSVDVFKGPYTGVNPANADDTVDLSAGYTENAKSSYPGFRWLIDGMSVLGNGE